MKIGISAIGYQCAEHIHKVLEPWASHRINAEVRVSVSHGLFPEVAALGMPQMSTDGTIAEMEDHFKAGWIQNLTVTEKPLYEKELRNVTLPYLFSENIDLLWLLDLQDEIYTTEDINSILSYIGDNFYYSWFKVNFKNYVINEKTYVNDFIAPRIWRMDRCGGIREFYHDNEIMFNNGVPQQNLPCGIIPREFAFVKHLSWVGSPDYLKRKIAFQKLHYGQCSYRWNEERNVLELDEDYYLKNKVPKPKLFTE